MDHVLTPTQRHIDRNFISCDFAIICFCPYSDVFDKYVYIEPEESFFMNLHPNQIKFCKFDEQIFIVLSYINDGIMSSVIDELNYYGVRCIFGIGLSLSLNDDLIDNIAMVKSTIYRSGQNNLDPYTMTIFDTFKNVNMWSTNNLYRIDSPLLQLAIKHSCNIIGLDMVNFVSSCQSSEMKYAYFSITPGTTNIFPHLMNHLVTTIFEKIPLIKKKIIHDHEIKKERIMNHLTKLFSDAKFCINHVMRVTDHVTHALKYEQLSIHLYYLVLYAAILHDANDKKFFKDDNVQYILEKSQVIKEDIELIKLMISFVAASENGVTIPEEAHSRPWLLLPRYAKCLDTFGQNHNFETNNRYVLEEKKKQMEPLL